MIEKIRATHWIFVIFSSFRPPSGGGFGQFPLDSAQRFVYISEHFRVRKFELRVFLKSLNHCLAPVECISYDDQFAFVHPSSGSVPPRRDGLEWYPRSATGGDFIIAAPTAICAQDYIATTLGSFRDNNVATLRTLFDSSFSNGHRFTSLRQHADQLEVSDNKADNNRISPTFHSAHLLTIFMAKTVVRHEVGFTPEGRTVRHCDYYGFHQIHRSLLSLKSRLGFFYLVTSARLLDKVGLVVNPYFPDKPTPKLNRYLLFRVTLRVSVGNRYWGILILCHRSLLSAGRRSGRAYGYSTFLLKNVRPMANTFTPTLLATYIRSFNWPQFDLPTATRTTTLGDQSLSPCRFFVGHRSPSSGARPGLVGQRFFASTDKPRTVEHETGNVFVKKISKMVNQNITIEESSFARDFRVLYDLDNFSFGFSVNVYHRSSSGGPKAGGLVGLHFGFRHLQKFKPLEVIHSTNQSTAVSALQVNPLGKAKLPRFGSPSGIKISLLDPGSLTVRTKEIVAHLSTSKNGSRWPERKPGHQDGQLRFDRLPEFVQNINQLSRCVNKQESSIAMVASHQIGCYRLLGVLVNYTYAFAVTVWTRPANFLNGHRFTLICFLETRKSFAVRSIRNSNPGAMPVRQS